MFGMGFTEILIIAVIAILFLGPDKLPSAMVDIAKFFRTAKNAIGSVKDTLEEEMNVSDIKKEALAYKTQLDNASSKLSKVTDVKAQIGSQIKSVLDDDSTQVQEETIQVEQNAAPKESQEVTFKKKPKKEENIDV
ncbi:Sec-independent protein translocase subunit TatB [Sulfurimonas sp. SAG-AH-194-C20]|nr:Sec-independent protein translocase protein TatB [Sulfurimonas sp. SAG-AH-194-C20]MDF1878535.1 Sec-independent protein translocase subunit TatB [Sulfurimonas sp. SAG-AH-194-C20]